MRLPSQNSRTTTNGGTSPAPNDPDISAPGHRHLSTTHTHALTERRRFLCVEFRKSSRPSHPETGYAATPLCTDAQPQGARSNS